MSCTGYERTDCLDKVDCAWDGNECIQNECWIDFYADQWFNFANKDEAQAACSDKGPECKLLKEPHSTWGFVCQKTGLEYMNIKDADKVWPGDIYSEKSYCLQLVQGEYEAPNHPRECLRGVYCLYTADYDAGTWMCSIAESADNDAFCEQTIGERSECEYVNCTWDGGKCIHSKNSHIVIATGLAFLLFGMIYLLSKRKSRVVGI